VLQICICTFHKDLPNHPPAEFRNIALKFLPLQPGVMAPANSTGSTKGDEKGAKATLASAGWIGYVVRSGKVEVVGIRFVRKFEH